MDEGKVTLVVDVDQIEVVFVDLDRRKLTLVDNVLVAQGTEVEPVVQADNVGDTLAQHIELALEVGLVKFRLEGLLGCFVITVCGLEDDEGLKDNRFSRGGCRTKQ